MSRKMFLASISANVSASASSTASAFILQCVSLRAPAFILCYCACQRRSTALVSIFLSVAFRLVSWPLYWPVFWYMSRVVPLVPCQQEKPLFSSALTSGIVFASVLAFTLEGVSPSAESGVSTFTSASVSPGVLAFYLCQRVGHRIKWRLGHQIGQCACYCLQLFLG